MDKFLAVALGSKIFNRAMNNILGHYVTIFMIHRSVSKDGSYQGLSPELLEQCLAYAVKNNFHFASIDEIVNDALNGITPKRPTLCFTLDDGFDDQAAELVPILLKYNAKPTLFVLTNFADDIDWPWDSRLAYMIWNSRRTSGVMVYKGKQFQLNLDSKQGRVETRRTLVKYAKYMSRAELDIFLDAVSKELAITAPIEAPDLYKPATWETLRHYENLGLKIGSHACSHRVFNSLTLDDVRNELVHAKARLDMELKSPSEVFCYPSGTTSDYSPIHAELVRDLGYKAAVSANASNPTLTAIKHDLFNIKRHGFPYTLERFIRYSSWLEAVRGRLS